MGWWVVGPLVAAALLVASFLSPAAAVGPTVVAVEYVPPQSPTHFNLSRMITIRPGDDYSSGEVERNRRLAHAVLGFPHVDGSESELD